MQTSTKYKYCHSNLWHFANKSQWLKKTGSVQYQFSLIVVDTLYVCNKSWGEEMDTYLTQDDPAVDAVQVEQPSVGDFGAVLHVRFQALSIDLQGVFVSKAAHCVNVNGRFGGRTSYIEGLLSHQLEHPVSSYNFLGKGTNARGPIIQCDSMLLSYCY